ncbi:MAG: hypothetical protein J6U54_18120 [Clostridiales bacterium]|nr:hypothetical protein [Clostridiales bacterium]
MEKRMCPNCGSELILRDGKYTCPMCGTDFAFDWGKEDVDQAAMLTAEERKAARFERNAKLNEAKEQINIMEGVRKQQRVQRSASSAMKRFGIIVAVVFGCYFVFSVIFRLVVSQGVSTLAKKDLDNVQFAEVNKETVEADEYLLENAISSGYYYVKYEIFRETWSLGLDSMVTKADDGKFIEAYYYEGDMGKSLCLFYEVTYKNDSGESTPIYYPIVINSLQGQPAGHIYSDYHTYSLTLVGDDIKGEDLKQLERALSSEYNGEKLDVPSEVIEKAEEGRS